MAERMIELQHQIRQNQSELRDYINDLDSWTEDIRKKDARLKDSLKAQGEPKSEKEFPPVRNALLKKKKKKVKKEVPSEPAKPTRISGYDFRSWDKFDVDKALEEVDVEKSSSSEYETDEEWEEERRVEQAKVLKSEGNEHYKHGRFTEAIECYSRGLEIDSTNPELPANRAQALLKQKCYAAAEKDCTLALELRPGYDKALFRRARARYELSRHTAAREDLRKVLTLNPQNAEARKLLYQIEEELRPEPERRPGLVVPIYKSKEKRSKRLLRRVNVTESGGEDPAAAAIQIELRARAAQSELTRTTLDKEQRMFERLAAAASTSPTEDSSNSSKVKSSECRVTELRDNEADNAENLTDSLPPVPTSSYQLMQDWRRLRTDPISFYCYFKRIQPSNYSQLLGEGLDAEFLTFIIKMLQNNCRSDGASVTLDCLLGLSKAKRFSFTVMFLGAKEKSELVEILTWCAQSDPEQARTVAKLYGVKL